MPTPSTIIVEFLRDRTYHTREGDPLRVPKGTRLVGGRLSSSRDGGRTFDFVMQPLLIWGVETAEVRITPVTDQSPTLRDLFEAMLAAARQSRDDGDALTAEARYAAATCQLTLLGKPFIGQRLSLEREMLQAQNAAARVRAAAQGNPIPHLGDEELREIGPIVVELFTHLGGYAYQMPSLTEGRALWRVMGEMLTSASGRGRVRASLREQGQAVGPLSADGHRRERLHLADRLTFDAWERGVPREEQALLADLAIALAPDHADSYAIHGWLAEQRGDLPVAQRWYAQGVAAGERFLGAASFAQAIRGERRFWGWVKTRRFMRARASLALVLWKQGLLHEAIPHY